jgi:prepilin-type N-terminal cleavage/methylation domain-containing protein
MATAMTVTVTVTETVTMTKQMRTATIEQGGKAPMRRRAENGFSLLEVLISMVILTVGLVSLLGVFGLAMAATQQSQQDMIAKQLANEAIESIMSARNTAQLSWDDIQNTGSTCANGGSGCGMFATGAQPIYQPITTATGLPCSKYLGIVGTTCDTSQPVQTLQSPGPDGIYGTADDVITPLTGYQRTILISPVVNSSGVVVSSLRGVNVTVSYTTPQLKLPKTYVLSSFISQYQ